MTAAGRTVKHIDRMLSTALIAKLDIDCARYSITHVKLSLVKAMLPTIFHHDFQITACSVTGCVESDCWPL